MKLFLRFCFKVVQNFKDIRQINNLVCKVLFSAVYSGLEALTFTDDLQRVLFYTKVCFLYDVEQCYNNNDRQ